MQYTIELPYWVQYFDNFKQKTAATIISNIAQCGMWEHIGKCEYGNVSFDESDISHKIAKYEPLSDFNRNKTNAILFDILETEDWPHLYDKLLIYTSNGKDGSFGFVMFNENCDYVTQTPAIENEYDTLVKRIKSVILSLPLTEKIIKVEAN